MREVMEETNILCSPISRLGERIHPDTGKLIVYWRCKHKTGKPTIQDITEIAEIRWVPPKEVSKLITSDIFPPIQSLLKDLAKQ